MYQELVPGTRLVLGTEDPEENMQLEDAEIKIMSITQLQSMYYKKYNYKTHVHAEKYVHN